MEFLKNNNPAYKSARVATMATQPTASNGLSGLIGSLFGSAKPSYKSAGGHAAKSSSSSSGLLSMFTVVPSYRMVSPVIVADVLDGDAIAEVAEAGELDAADEDAVCELAPDEIVLL